MKFKNQCQKQPGSRVYFYNVTRTHLFQIVSFWILPVVGSAVHRSAIAAVAWSLTKHLHSRLLAAGKQINRVWSSHGNGLNNPWQSPLSLEEKKLRRTTEKYTGWNAAVPRVDFLVHKEISKERLENSRMEKTRSLMSRGQERRSQPSTPHSLSWEQGTQKRPACDSVTPERFPDFQITCPGKQVWGSSPSPALQTLPLHLLQ